MSEVTEARTKVLHSCILLDRSGHRTLAWDSADDAEMLPWIRRMLNEGAIFYIVTRSWPLREERLRRVEDIGSRREVVMHSEDADRVFRAGRLGVVDDDEDEDDIDHGRRARTAEEVASHDTVAHRQLRGG